jgi:hypothetical protein
MLLINVCSEQLCFRYESARKCCIKFKCKFPGEAESGRQKIHYLVSKLKTGLLLIRKLDRKLTVHTEEMDVIGLET